MNKKRIYLYTLFFGGKHIGFLTLEEIQYYLLLFNIVNYQIVKTGIIEEGDNETIERVTEMQQ